MATLVGDLKNGRPVPLFARRRAAAAGERAGRMQKAGRCRVLGLKHVLLVFALLVGIFVAVREAYVFLITWDELTIRKVEVACPKDDLRATLDRLFAAPRLGNILLCDLEALRADIRRLAWVKDVSVQKVFPSTLRLAVVVRAPFALLERNGLYLADEEGRVLEPAAAAGEMEAWPVISAENGFVSGLYEKWDAAAGFLRVLPAGERARLAGVRCGEDGTLELSYRDDPVRVVVRPATAAERLALFRSLRLDWESRFGPLAAVNLSYDGRVYLRPAAPAEPAGPQTSKEAL